MSNLLKRVLTAIVGIPLGIYFIFSGGILFALVVLIIAIIGYYEYLLILKARGYKPFFVFGIFPGLIFHLFIYMYLNEIYKIDLQLVSISILAILLIYLSNMVFFGKKRKIEDLMLSFGGNLYIFGLLSPIVIIREFPNGEYLITSLLFSIWLCDTFAYAFGRKFGKHKLSPVISPNKTIEGSVAGLVGAILTFSVLAHYIIDCIDWKTGIICGLIVGVMGQIGDLFESSLKRSANIKDSSQLIPGHGGVLDRFDSLIFATPSLFIFLYFIL